MMKFRCVRYPFLGLYQGKRSMRQVRKKVLHLSFLVVEGQTQIVRLVLLYLVGYIKSSPLNYYVY